MSHLRLPAATSEYVKVRVRVDDDQTDPTADFTPYFAIVDKDTAPTDLDWQAAAWESGGPPYYVRRITSHAAGLFRLWVKIESASEAVVRPAGVIEFYEVP